MFSDLENIFLLLCREEKENYFDFLFTKWSFFYIYKIFFFFTTEEEKENIFFILFCWWWIFFFFFFYPEEEKKKYFLLELRRCGKRFFTSPKITPIQRIIIRNFFLFLLWKEKKKKIFWIWKHTPPPSEKNKK